MYGRKTPLKSHWDRPAWITRICAKELPRPLFATLSVNWFPAEITKSGASYSIEFHNIEIRCPNEETRTGKMLLLHQIAHVLSPEKGPPITGAGRITPHTIEWHSVAATLFARYHVYMLARYRESAVSTCDYLGDSKKYYNVSIDDLDAPIDLTVD